MTDAPTPDAALVHALDGAFAGVGRIDVVGALPGGVRGRFAAADGSPSADGAVLVVGGEPDDLARGVSLARAGGLVGVTVLLDGPPTDATLARLHESGLAVAGTERVLWRSPETPTGSRRDRLDAETRAVLLRCVVADDPGAVASLEAAVRELERRADVLAQLQLEHARTRDVERERQARLEQLERMVDVDSAAEAARLAGELEELRSTRIVKLGARYWTLRDRLLGR